MATDAHAIAAQLTEHAKLREYSQMDALLDSIAADELRNVLYSISVQAGVLSRVTEAVHS